MKTAIVFLFLVSLALTHAVKFSQASDEKNFPDLLAREELEAYYEVKQLYQAVFGDKGVKAKYLGKPSKLLSFSFSNCGDPAKEIAVPSKVSVKPDPIRLPGNVTVSGDLTITEAFGSPVKTDLKVEKHTFLGWVTVPCIDGVGSCSYDDVCTKVNPKTCPKIFQKIKLNCKCPFAAGKWSVPSTSFYLDLSAPVSGDVRVTAHMYYQGKLVTCGQVVFTLA